jgi:hypothetical protein
MPMRRTVHLKRHFPLASHNRFLQPPDEKLLCGLIILSRKAVTRIFSRPVFSPVSRSTHQKGGRQSPFEFRLLIQTASGGLFRDTPVERLGPRDSGRSMEPSHMEDGPRDHECVTLQWFGSRVAGRKSDGGGPICSRSRMRLVRRIPWQEETLFRQPALRIADHKRADISVKSDSIQSSIPTRGVQRISRRIEGHGLASRMSKRATSHVPIWTFSVPVLWRYCFNIDSGMPYTGHPLERRYMTIARASI